MPRKHEIQQIARKCQLSPSLSNSTEEPRPFAVPQIQSAPTDYGTAQSRPSIIEKLMASASSASGIGANDVGVGASDVSTLQARMEGKNSPSSLPSLGSFILQMPDGSQRPPTNHATTPGTFPSLQRSPLATGLSPLNSQPSANTPFLRQHQGKSLPLAKTQPLAPMQAKLAVGAIDDAYEQEADQAAFQVTGAIQSSSQLATTRSSQAQPIDYIHGTSGTPIQGLWNKQKFKAETKEGLIDRRGKTIKTIEGLLAEYAKYNPYSTKDLRSVQDLLLEIREHVQNWIYDHSDDKSRSQRMEGMKKFLIHLDTEEIPKLKKIEQQIKDPKNTTAGTLDISDSQRQGNVKVIKDKYEGSAKSGLTKVGWMIDAAVPNPGDKSKLEVELKVPVEPSGVGFVGLHLVCQAERKKAAELNARCELTVTGGAKFGGLAELKAELGGYFESQAETSDQVMAIISYALYRRFVESKVIPVETSNYMWGGTTSNVGYKRAERWAGNVEKEIFGKTKAYAETGAIASGTAQGGIKDVGGVGLEGKLGIKGGIGTRYDKTSIQEGKKRLFGPSGDLGQTYTYKGRGDAQKNIGRSAYLVEAALEGKVALFKVNGKAKWVWLGDPKKDDDLALDEWSVEASGTASLPLHEGVLGGAPHALAGYINFLAQMARKASMEKTGKNGQALGLAVGASEDLAIAATQMAKVPAKQFQVFKPGKSLNDQMGTQVKGEIGVKVQVKYKRKGGVGSWEISIDYVKTGQLGVVGKILEAQQNAVDMLTVKLEKSSRLFTLKYEGDKWSVNPELD